MRISVLICTRNRAASLRDTLEVIFDQTPSANYEYEVVVVDNASTDTTRLVIAEFIATLPTKHYGRLRYCYEPRPGLSYARNTALRAAQGDVLVFTDDDIFPEPNWLNEIHREFAADPNLYVLGGRVLLAHSGLQPVGKIAPQADAAETFVQQDERRRLIRLRPDHAEFKALIADGKDACAGKRHALIVRP